MDPCRICLKPKPSNFLTNIHTATFQYVSYRHIYSYFGTVLEDHQEFPLVICGDCEFQMIGAYKFKMKCLEAEIKISLILQAKSEMDKSVDEIESDDLIEFSGQQQEMEINLISSLINVPEILSIDCDDSTRGDHSNFLPSSTSLIEFNEQFDYDDTNILNGESDEVYNGSTLSDLFATERDSGDDSVATNPKYTLLLDQFPLEIPTLEDQNCDKCKTPLNGEIDCRLCKDLSNITVSEKKNNEQNDIEKKTVQKKKFVKQRRKIRERFRKIDESCEKCEICGIYIKAINKARHLELHQNKAANKQYPCQICGKTFVLKYYANDHVRRVHRKDHGDQSKIKCTICSKEVQKYHWKRHVRSHRKFTEDRPFSCHLCQKTFISKDTIRAHIVTVHLKEKRYECHLCGEKFIHSLTRYRHINRQHLNKQVASCSLCSASFYHRTSLVAHRRKFHPPAVTLKCDGCTAIFFDRRQLKRHLLVHIDKNFTCEYCGDGFMKKKKLMSHLESHKTFQNDCICSICGIGFEKTCQLHYHMEERHSG
ncbi:hypothetical protein DMENIID0001_080340 [Sergentomyia squamirostris]